MKTTTTLTFVWRIASAHTITYFIAGIFALTILNYDELFNTGSFSFMRATDSACVAAGIGLQLIRGVLIGII